MCHGVDVKWIAKTANFECRQAAGVYPLFLWGIFVSGDWVEHVSFNSLVGEAVKTNRFQLVQRSTQTMSEYLKSLDKDATARYLAKQDVLGLKETDDPYASWNEAKFINEMLWPPVEYSHIFCYFIDRPGVYTRKQLMQWKSMEAYNFFKNWHVHTV